MSERFAEVRGVESNPQALVRLRENASRATRNNIKPLRADLFNNTGLDQLKELGQASLVLLDPPRNGALDLVKRIADKPPKQVVYVSCDPATFARDAKVLVAGGLSLRSVLPVDLFPQTHHIEMVGVFTA